jgi:hypothetical protein
MVKSEECVAGGTGFGGLGLGLTISKAIVELHGGKIFASSAGPAHGAMFVIELPNVVSSSVERPSSRTDSSSDCPGARPEKYGRSFRDSARFQSLGCSAPVAMEFWLVAETHKVCSSGSPGRKLPGWTPRGGVTRDVRWMECMGGV